MSVDDDNAQDESDDDQSMFSLLSHLSSNDYDDQSIEIKTGLNELLQMLSDDSSTDIAFNAQDVSLRNDGGSLGSDYDLEEPYDTMDPTNVHGTLQQDDFDDYVTLSKDPDMPLAEIIEEVSEFGNDPIPTSNIGEYAAE
eukprot:12717075-Ditylum_brightwellii.AAC.1